MGVSLSYSSTQPIAAEAHRRLLALAAETNRAYHWWCEPICVISTADDAGHAFGSTKLFCLIDDVDADTYMAYLDVNAIIRFLSTVAVELSIQWKLEIEGSPFGGVTATGPDDELRGNLSRFLDMFPGDFEPLRARSRADILAQWPDR